jgi:hypothetical protein
LAFFQKEFGSLIQLQHVINRRLPEIRLMMLLPAMRSQELRKWNAHKRFTKSSVKEERSQFIRLAVAVVAFSTHICALINYLSKWEIQFSALKALGPAHEVSATQFTLT